MLTEKKKTAAIIQRLKKWKKYKGISKEDIEKFATAEEKKRLLEGDDPFEDVHGEADPFDIPIGDPQDPTDDEPRPLEDEQEAGTQGRTFDEDFAEEAFENFIGEADDATLLKMAAVIEDELEGRDAGDENNPFGFSTRSTINDESDIDQVSDKVVEEY